MVLKNEFMKKVIISKQTGKWHLNKLLKRIPNLIYIWSRLIQKYIEHFFLYLTLILLKQSNVFDEAEPRVRFTNTFVIKWIEIKAYFWLDSLYLLNESKCFQHRVFCRYFSTDKSLHFGKKIQNFLIGLCWGMQNTCLTQ